MLNLLLSKKKKKRLSQGKTAGVLRSTLDHQLQTTPGNLLKGALLLLKVLRTEAKKFWNTLGITAVVETEVL